MTRRIRVLLAGLLAAFAVLAPAGAASAHDALSRSTPKNNAEVVRAPAEVTLTYTSSVLKLGSVVRVLGPDGENVTDGSPSFTDTKVTQPLQPDLPAGKYRIDWQVTSSDGHPIAGKLAFTVTEGATATRAAPTATPSETAAAAPTTAAPTTTPPTTISPATGAAGDEGSSWASPAAFALIAVVIVIAVVGAAVLARRRS